MDLVLTVSVHLPVLLNNVHQQPLLGFCYNIPWAKWMNPNELPFFCPHKKVYLCIPYSMRKQLFFFVLVRVFWLNKDASTLDKHTINSNAYPCCPSHFFNGKHLAVLCSKCENSKNVACLHTRLRHVDIINTKMLSA